MAFALGVGFGVFLGFMANRLGYLSVHKKAPSRLNSSIPRGTPAPNADDDR